MEMKKTIRKYITTLSKKSTLFRLLVKKSLFVIRYLKYRFVYSKQRVNDKMIIFESFMGKSFTDSPKAIYLYMINEKKYRDYKFVWAFKNPSEKKKYFSNKNTVLVQYGTKEYYMYYATAKYWVSNSRIPEHIIKKNSQIYVQTWHGTPLKKLGYDIEVVGGNVLNSNDEIKEKYLSDAKKFDYMVSPSKFCTEKYISSFNLSKLNKEDIIIEKGYPRNDSLFKYTNEDIRNIKNNLNVPKGKKVILYAPTWRDNQHTSGIGYTYELGLDIDKMYNELKDDYVMLFRTHYFALNSHNFDKYKDFILDVSTYDEVNDLYIVSDILLTDYSSVFFDYANLKRPMIFYMYDLDEYENKLRGFYFDIKELPGPIVRKEKDLINAIKNIDITKYEQKYKQFNAKFNYLDNKDTAREVTEVFINGKDSSKFKK